MQAPTATLVRIGVAGVLMPPHSTASTAAATQRMPRNQAPPRRTAQKAASPSTTALATRSPRLRQSNEDLTGGEDVIQAGAAIAPLPLHELADGLLQVLGAVVRPQDVLEHE